MCVIGERERETRVIYEIIYKFPFLLLCEFDKMKFSAIRSLSLSLIVPFLALFPFALSASSDSEQAIDDEFKRVTCRSNVKLAHKPSGHRLHSHSITYGSGSGQQSVTGFPGGDDPNSYWIVVEQFRDAECARGYSTVQYSRERERERSGESGRWTDLSYCLGDKQVQLKLCLKSQPIKCDSIIRLKVSKSLREWEGRREGGREGGTDGRSKGECLT